MKISNSKIPGKAQLRVYDYPIDLYNKSVHIYIGKTMADACFGAESEFKIDLQDIINKGMIACAVKITNDEGVMANILLIDMRYADSYNLLVTCAHEAVHVSWDILDKVGIDIYAENHEAQAYLVDTIFGACKWAVEDYIKRYKLKIKL